MLDSKTSFGGETSGDVGKRHLFSSATPEGEGEKAGFIKDFQCKNAGKLTECWIGCPLPTGFPD